MIEEVIRGTGNGTLRHIVKRYVGMSVMIVTHMRQLHTAGSLAIFQARREEGTAEIEVERFSPAFSPVGYGIHIAGVTQAHSHETEICSEVTVRIGDKAQMFLVGKINGIALHPVVAAEHSFPVFSGADYIGRIIRIERTVAPVVDIDTELRELRIPDARIIYAKVIIHQLLVPWQLFKISRIDRLPLSGGRCRQGSESHNRCYK